MRSKTFALAVLLAFGAPATAWAQALTGTKEVPSASYPTVVDAVTALNNNGTAAPGVTFRIHTGTYNGALSISRADIAAGAPAVFEPFGDGVVTLTAPAGTPVVTLSGADNVKFSGLTITAAGQHGVLIQGGATNVTLERCTINVSGDTMDAIRIPDSGNHSLFVNKCLLAGSLSADCGIRLACGIEANASGWKIYNNFIPGFDVAGIYLSQPGGHEEYDPDLDEYYWVEGADLSGWAYHNSIRMDTGANASNAVYYNNPGGSMVWRNNVYAQLSSNAASYGFYHANGGLDSDYNDFYRPSGASTGFNGAARISLLDWQKATGKDYNGIAGDPRFFGAADLHLQDPSYCQGAAQPGLLTDDYDGTAREALPDIGADENTAADGTPPMNGATVYTVGAGKTYSTLVSAVEDLTNRTQNGPVTFDVYTGAYSQTLLIGPVRGNSAANTITFRKAAAAGGAADLGPIKLWLVDYVTFQGFDSITATGTPAVSLESGNTNIILTGNAITATNANAVSIAGGADVVTISGGSVSSTGASTISVSGTNVSILGSTVTLSGSAGMAAVAVPGSGSQGLTVSQSTVNASGDGTYAVNVTGSGSTNFKLERCTLAGSSAADVGLRLAVGVEANAMGWKIYNNFIYGFDVAGIYLSHPGGHEDYDPDHDEYYWVDGADLSGWAYHNSIRMDTGANASNAVYYNNPGGTIIWRNNIYAQLSSNAASYGFYYADGGLDSDYNDFYRPSGAGTGFYGAARATLAQWQAATSGKDLNSIPGNPKFAGAADLHIQNGSLCVAKALKALLNDDRDGEIRDANTPDIGADENLLASAVSGMSGLSTVGTGKTYATLVAAVDDLTSRGVSGAVTLDVYAGAYSGASLGPIKGTSNANTITFQKAADAGGAVDLGAVSFLNSAYVIFKGFDSITATGAPAVSLSGSTNISLLNNASISGTNAAAVSIANGSNNATVSGNTITAANGNGILLSGSTGASLSSNSVTVSGADAIAVTSGSTGASLQSNTVAVSGTGKAGLSVGSSNHNLTVSQCVFNPSGDGTYAVNFAGSANNNFTLSRSTLAGSGGADVGLRLALGAEASATGWKIYNNFIYGFDVAGIYLSHPGGHDEYDPDWNEWNWVDGVDLSGWAYFNSILMDTGANASNAVYYNNPGGSMVWRNNIYAQLSSNANSYGFYRADGSIDTNYNDFHHPDAAKAGFYGAPQDTLAAWKAATGMEAAGKEVDPEFASTAAPIDLHLGGASACQNAGTDVGVGVDHDGDLRPFPAGGSMDIGADEFYDTTPPGPIGSFSAAALGPFGIRLTWRAGGDDGNLGTATEYDVRYRTDVPITEDNWGTSTPVANEPVPAVYDTPQSLDVNGLNESTTHWFGIKARDEANLWSPLSVASATTKDGTAPARITTLVVKTTTLDSVTLEWFSPGDDGNVGTATSYDVRYSTLGAINTDAKFDAATQASGEPAPAVTGTLQSMIVGGLTTSTIYWFAIKAADEDDNWSLVSDPSPSGSTDRTPPAAAVVSLTGARNRKSIEISWLAPGDDGAVGTATAYQVRYSSAGAIDTEEKWLAANIAANPPAVLPPGSLQTLNVTGLFGSTTYWFSVRTVDEAPNSNWSPLSNSPSETTTANNGPASVTIGGQFRLDGTTSIAVGGATYETGVVFKGTPATDPDGDPVRVEIEIQPVGTDFANAPSAWSAYGSGGAPVAFTYTTPADGNFHWQARAIDDAGAASAWVSFGGNLENERDFFIDGNPPQTVLLTSGTYNASTYAGMIQGTCTDGAAGSGVASIRLSIRRSSDNQYWNGVSWQAAAAWIPVTVAANWSVPFAASDVQTYSLTAYAVDNGGLVETPPVTSTFTYDGVEPDSAVLTAGGMTSGSYDGAIHGTASDIGSSVDVVEITIQWAETGQYWNGTAWGASPVWLTATGTNSWTRSFTPADFQNYNVQSRATDAAGNVETTLGASSFSYGLSGPDSIVSTSGWYRPADWSAIQGQAVTTSVGASVTKVELTVQRASDGLFWSGSAWTFGPTWLTASGSDSWTYAFVPTNGESYVAQSRATDTWDVETSYGTATFGCDATVPTSAILTSGIYTTDTWSGLIQGTASDTGSGVEKVEVSVMRSSDGLYWNGAGWGSSQVWQTAAGSTNWAFAFPAEVGQGYLAEAHAIDQAGNTQPDVAASFSVLEGPGDRTGNSCSLSASAPGAGATATALLAALLALIGTRRAKKP